MHSAQKLWRSLGPQTLREMGRTSEAQPEGQSFSAQKAWQLLTSGAIPYIPHCWRSASTKSSTRCATWRGGEAGPCDLVRAVARAAWLSRGNRCVVFCEAESEKRWDWGAD